MIKILSSKIFWGIGLIIGGVLLLLDTFGIIKGGSLFWTFFVGAAGLLFLIIFITNHDHWWALVPGIIFLTTAVTIGFNSYYPNFSDLELTGPIILGGIALSFLLVFLAERSNWWAIIPAGMTITIAIVAIIDSSTSLTGGGIFFLGLGLTFAVVALLPNTEIRLNWAWIPASILGVMGILILVTAEEIINYLWPAALMIVGLFLIIRSIRSKN